MAALVSATLVAPTSAATVTTRWVDDDGKAGPSSCNGTRTAHRTIQKGVNAADSYDVVKVCPGTYVGRVTIKGARTGLVLRAATSTTPILKARDDFDASTTYLVTIDHVAKVTVRDLRIRPLRASSHAYCSVSTGIRAIDATNVTITRNDIRPTGSGAFCGVYDGITASTSTTGSITSNVIRDFRNNGIELSGSSTDVTVRSNSVTFAHVGLNTAGGSAVLVRAGATAAVRSNTLNGPASGAGNPPQPAAGVQLNDVGSDTLVAGNTIARFAADIRVTHANGGTIRDNTLTGGQVGIELLDADGVHVYGNVSSAATVHGLYVSGGSSGLGDASKTTGANVHDNDFRSNANGGTPDCRGESTPADYVITTNTFLDNVNTTSSPSELCDGGVVPE
jgi:hypothetical protein